MENVCRLFSHLCKKLGDEAGMFVCICLCMHKSDWQDAREANNSSYLFGESKENLRC